MGAPPDPDQLLRQLEDPNTLQLMTEAMNNPIVIQQIRNSPMFRNNPMMQQMFDNPAFRRMLTDPEVIRQQMQMARSFGGMGGAGGNSAFPAPGVTNTTPQGQSTNNNDTGSTATGDATTATPNQPNNTGPTSPPPNPFAMFGNPAAGAGAGAGGAAANPFTALFGAPPSGSPTPGQNQEGQGPNANPATNPFGNLFGAGAGGAPGGQGDPFQAAAQNLMQNPEAMRATMQMLGLAPPGGEGNTPGATGGDAQAANPFAGLFGGAGLPSAGPPDNRPPEERYAEQLRQLNDMGFYEFERNIQALRRSGGSVQGAVEYLLNGS